MKTKIITIDGPAGTGKTTVAKQVAEKLGYQYFDTGAMFRALTYRLLQEKIPLEDALSLKDFLERFKFDIRSSKGGYHYFVLDEDVTEKIRSKEVTGRVSEVAANSAVRHLLAKIQKDFGFGKNAVFEGRDMGTVIFPEAKWKIFLTARPAVRAERRYQELQLKADTRSEQEILQEILVRDQMDSTREYAPLKQAEDAFLIDTSDLTIEQVVESILKFIHQSP